ncbi:hypothetical protein JK386_16785 [Nocardioides sp. zg-536]|uniref:Uncharacterized protein n=1 Tax=Nocardioides faecalis TaxID=2803858 RepID=A0A939BUD4_9ACTN|nr:hypothetical protein [Nocardioides faecalis]MBM9461559.1 hypothetical protein [Nocardioides faecalis]QVI57807.1 hypothetical protein KG111_12120 [Nocardioides faecalis]
MNTNLHRAAHRAAPRAAHRAAHHAAPGSPARRVAALAVAVGLALSACSATGTADSPDSDRAKQLAKELNDNLRDVDLPTVNEESARALYGTDGGVSCENADELQQQLSLAQFGNNALHLRRVVLDPSVIAYDVAVIKTYCPDRAEDLQKLFDKLDTEETVPSRSASPGE